MEGRVEIDKEQRLFSGWIKQFRPACAGVLASVAMLCLLPRASVAQTSMPTTRTVPSTQPVGFYTGEASIEQLHVQPGFTVELFAEEPMVVHPVSIAFDPDGRAWCCEMRSYMPDALGHGEDVPGGRISVLEDTDGDGKADKYTVFLDGLVMPRAVAPVKGGVLIATPPNLAFYPDADNDLKPDGPPTIIATDYGIGKWNPEHQPNGLITMLDNWIYSAGYDYRIHRTSDGKWERELVPEMGQWGICQDDYGRLYFNSNSDYLRCAVIPPHYAAKNPNYLSNSANVKLASTQACYPKHNSAINRGYREGVLRDDGSLASFTAACGPMIYRGGLFPPAYNGQAFIGEVSANLIRQAKIVDDANGVPSVLNALDKEEFLDSTDERFRPVSLYNGPDGAVWVVDMHHGLIQHRNFLTTYARAQYLGRQLDKHMDAGRIYRIVPNIDRAKTPGAPPKLSSMPSKELIEQFKSPNGWMRDTAQQLIVERNEWKVARDLKKLAATDGPSLPRIHALWTLEGLRMQDPITLSKTLESDDPQLQIASLRVGQWILNSERRRALLPAVMKLANSRNPDVMVQFALSTSSLGEPEVDRALADIAFDAPNDFVRDAIITGLRGRELTFLERMLDDSKWRGERAGGRAQMISMLIKCVVAEGKAKNMDRALELMAAQPAKLAWRRVAMMEGLPDVPKDSRVRKPRPIILEGEPAGLVALRDMKDDAVKSRMPRLDQLLHWPGQPGYMPPPPPPPLSADEQSRFEIGRGLFTNICMPCHKATGLGQAGLAPPLLDSEWVLGPPSWPIRIITHGLGGPVSVAGTTYNLEMPALPTLQDDEIAAILTYVRREWGHTASPVDVATVKKVRADGDAKLGSYTERELLQTP